MFRFIKNKSNYENETIDYINRKGSGYNHNRSALVWFGSIVLCFKNIYSIFLSSFFIFFLNDKSVNYYRTMLYHVNLYKVGLN